MFQLLILASIAGGMIPLGAVLARVENLHPAWLEDEFRHSVIAFGAGALLAAVAFVLIPDGAAAVPAWSAPLILIAGGAVMALVDRLIGKSGGQAGQFIAMLADFLPEVIALGALYTAGGGGSAVLLALLIGLQNLPEGFNAYRERIAAAPAAGKRVLITFCVLALIGPVGAILGYSTLAHDGATLGVMMLFAAGAILYLMFQDIAPQVPLERKFGPAIGAVAGMALGLAGDLMLG